MIRKNWQILWGAVLLFLLVFDVAYAIPQGQNWHRWVEADLTLSRALSEQRTYLLDSGQVIKEFSQGRILRKAAEDRLKSLNDKAAASFSKITRLDSSADPNMYACGLEVARQQTAQIRAAHKLMQRENISHDDILTLQSREAAVSRAGSRYLKARRSSVKSFLEGWNKVRAGKVTVGQAGAPNQELVNYYRFQVGLLALQSEELEYSETILDCLQKIAGGDKAEPLSILDKVRGLSGRCGELKAESENLQNLQKDYVRELDSFYHFAEAVDLLQKDVSADSTSRLSRWSAKLQRDSRAAETRSMRLQEGLLRAE